MSELPGFACCRNSNCQDFKKIGTGNISYRGWYYGKDHDRRLLYCKTGGRRFAATQGSPLLGVHLPVEKVHQIFHHAAEGVGVRATARLLGLTKNTVNSDIVKVGEHRQSVYRSLMRDLQMNEVQLDVLWTFVKKKRPLTRSNSSKGEVWIWTAVDTTTRVIVNYRVGTHFLEDARIMLKELTSSLSGRSPLFVSDELAHYESVLEELFSHDEPVPRTGKRGRPPNPVRVVEPDPLYATMKKTRKKGRMVKVDQYVKTPKTGKLSKKFTLFSVSYKRQLPKKGLFAG